MARCFGAHYGDEVQQLFSRRNDRARVYAKLGGCKRILAMDQAYIIALGNNDSFVFGHPLGSVKDVNAECPQDNADTFFGNMGKIVCKLKTIEPNARIFVVTPQLRVMPAIKIFVISQANLPNCAICLTLRTCWI